MRYVYFTTTLLFLVLFYAATPHFTQAQEDGTTGVILLESLPNVGEASTPAPDLGKYLDGVFKLAIGVATGLAVLMIVLGGLEYMGSDSVFKKDAGKEKIQDALWGLLLALGAFLLLQTINPDLVRFNIVSTLERVTQQARDQANTTSGDGEIEPTGQEAVQRQNYLAAGIGVKNPPCQPGQNEVDDPCLNLAGMPPQVLLVLRGVLRDLQNVPGATVTLCSESNQNSCTMVVTGGTGPGHETHGINEPFVDFRKNQTLDRYIRETALSTGCSERVTTASGQTFDLYKIGGSSYVDEGNHWHACINTACRFDGYTQHC